VKLGVQTKNIIEDKNPSEGFTLIKKAGFDCVDFSLNEYLTNTALYQERRNSFFDRTQGELEEYFLPHKRAAQEAGIDIFQMHMPYPNYVPGASRELNAYLWEEVAPKSLRICYFLGCTNIVIHGVKLAQFYGSEEAEWAKTREFIESLAPTAKELGITICIENLYTGQGEHIVEGPCCNAVKAAKRIDEINEKYSAEVLGFCLDTGHANLVGLDFEKCILTLGPRLKVLHIHDNDGVRDLHQIPFVYTRSRENVSSTDWKGFVSGLRRIGFDGVLSFETAPVLDAFPKELKEDTLLFIAKIGGYFACEIKSAQKI